MLSYVAAYDDFVQDKIYQENELINKINTLLVLKETTTLHEKSEKLTAMYEAKISDTVKAKWKAFVDFIKQQEGGSLPTALLEHLDEAERVGIEVDENVNAEVFTENINDVK